MPWRFFFFFLKVVHKCSDCLFFFKIKKKYGLVLKSLLSLLQYCFYFMFWFFGHEECGMLPP